MGSAQFRQSAGGLAFSSTLPSASLFTPWALRFTAPTRPDVIVITNNLVITNGFYVTTNVLILTNTTVFTNQSSIITNVVYSNSVVLTTNLVQLRGF